VTALAPPRPAVAVQRRAARGFWIASAVLALFATAASSPSPLYGVYAERWGFSPATLTLVFAVYAFALLSALLLFGTLSDAVGRKPVVLAAIAILSAALCVFIAADGVAWLLIARTLQGFATGLSTAAVSAWLLDLQPESRPGHAALVNASFSTGGLALGAVYSGALVEYAPAQRQLVYFGLLAVLGGMAVVVARRVDETRPRTGRVRPHLRIGVAPAARGAFLAVLPCLASTWSIAGLYLSLGPTLTLSLGHSDNHLAGATAVALLCGVGGAAAAVVQNAPPRRVMLSGCVWLIAGVLVAAAAIATSSLWLFLASTVVAGVGFGIAFLGALRTLVALASPDERGALVAAIYTAAYLAFSIPAIVAGLVATHVGVRDTAIGYSLAVAALAATALVTTTRIR
jgi:MFS family permease